jgi:hypothetical protein
MKRQMSDYSIKATRQLEDGSIETGTFLSFAEFEHARELEGWSSTEELNARADARIQEECFAWGWLE